MKNKQILKAITEIKDGTMTVIASDESVDRVGDSIKVLDWDLKNFKKNPVLQAGHDYRPQFTIGVAKNIRVEGKKLLFEPKFHTITELAKEIKAMYEEGVLKAWSVGFIPHRLKEEEKKMSNELLEVSAVAVPANANALVMAKGMNQEEEGEIKEKLDEFISEESEEEESKEEAEEPVEEKPVEEEPVEEKETVEEPVEETPEEEIPEEIPVEEVSVEEEIPEETPKEETLILEPEKKEVIAKEGRVISAKNKKLVNNAIISLKETIDALEKLLQISEVPEKSVEQNLQKLKGIDKQGRRTKKIQKKLTIDELTVCTLKEISKKTSFALNKINHK